LLDFPSAKYELQIDCHSLEKNVIKDKDNNVLGYDFKSPINLSECYLVNLLVPSTATLNRKHKIEFHAKRGKNYNKSSHNVQKCEKFYYDIYPYDTYHVGLEGPTESLLIKVKPSDTNLLDKYYYNNAQEILIRLDGENYGKYLVDVGNNECLVKFTDPTGKYKNAQNGYLSEDYNNNSLNLSKVDSCEIITINCELLHAYQNVYSIYNFPEMVPLF
jgi:hypothetical protein